MVGGAALAALKTLQGRRGAAPATPAPVEWPPFPGATPVTVPEPAVDVEVAPGPDPQPLRDEPTNVTPEPALDAPPAADEPVTEVHTGDDAVEHFADASRQQDRPLTDWEPTAPLPPAEETTPLTPPQVPKKRVRKAPLTAAPEPAQEAPATETASAAPPWIDPVQGECPETHPVKGKLASRIFHAPGGLNYPRTRPDRCYVDAAAAEADGLRPSKR